MTSISVCDKLLKSCDRVNLSAIGVDKCSELGTTTNAAQMHP